MVSRQSCITKRKITSVILNTINFRKSTYMVIFKKKKCKSSFGFDDQSDFCRTESDKLIGLVDAQMA